MNRTRRSLVVLAVVAPLLLASCGGDEGSAGAEKTEAAPAEGVTVVLDYSPNTNHAGVYLAEASGWYDEAGIDIDIVEPGDAGSLALLGAGGGDVAFTYQEALVPARAAGAGVVGVAGVIEHNTSSLLTLASDGVERPRDLEGKRYGGYGGPLEEALVRDLVACDGGDPDAVEFAEVGETDYRVGLTADRYDAVWIFDGWDGIRLRDIDGLDTATIPFLDHTDCIPDWYTPMLAATQTMIDERPEVLRSFLDVTARGYREAMRDPQAAVDALMDAVPELDQDLVERSAEYLSTRYASDPARWGEMDEGRFSEFVTYLVDSGLIDEEIDVDAAFTNRFLPLS